MARRMKGIGLALYVLAIVAGLGFGAAALQAQPVDGCPDDGWEFLGACSSQLECDLNCINVHFPNEQGGKCFGGCCTCYL